MCSLFPMGGETVNFYLNEGDIKHRLMEDSSMNY